MLKLKHKSNWNWNQKETFFLANRPRLINRLIKKALRNNIKVKITLHHEPPEKPHLVYHFDYLQIHENCGLQSYKVFRKEINKHIQRKKIKQFEEEINNIILSSTDGKLIVNEAIKKSILSDIS